MKRDPAFDLPTECVEHDWQWNGVLWVCQTCGEPDDMRDPPPVDLRAEYEDYAADCREYGVRK